MLEFYKIGIDSNQFNLLGKFLTKPFSAVLDIGAGSGSHSLEMSNKGKRVTIVDIQPENLNTSVWRKIDNFIIANITSLPLANESFDAIWSSHCLEHVLDPLSVLVEWRRVLKKNGYLGIVVPPFKTQVVGRHVFTGWTTGQLMLTLLRAGYKIRNGSYLQLGYNVCAIVQKGDLIKFKDNDEILCKYSYLFPKQIQDEIESSKRKNTFGETISCFEGDISSLGW